jgi:CRP-like cAMP-binding protein
VTNIHPSSHRLADVPLFANLSPALLDDLAGATRVRTYPHGQILVHEGDPGDHLIVLEAGQLRISRYLPSGDEVVLAVIDAPAAVGELALLDGAPRDATVTAQRAVTVRLVPRSTFLDLLKRESVAMEGLLRTLAALVRAGNARHADFVGLDVPGRLAKWLLRQSDHPGADPQVVLQCSQGELAAELGTTRSTLNRTLHEFASQGMLTMDGNRITLLDREGLRSHTG